MRDDFKNKLKKIKKDLFKARSKIEEMNVTDLEKLGAAMADPVATEWDKANNCKDTVYGIDLVD